MGTKRRGTARSKPSPGRARPGGRVSRNRLEKIPIPPVPAFLHSTNRAPDKKQEPGSDLPPGIISPDAISDEEADILLGVTSPAEPDLSLPEPGQSPISELPEGALTEDEADELLGLSSGTAVFPIESSPQPTAPVDPDDAARSGASGAAVLNDLVDEIEKDLERDLERHAPAIQSPRYGRTIGCWVSPLADDSHLQTTETRNREHEEEETR